MSTFKINSESQESHVQLLMVLISVDTFDCIAELFNLGQMPKSITSSFLALISKIANPQGFNDFRPIFLIGSMYKTITKMLASRLKVVIGKLISQNKTTFLKTDTC